MQTFSEQDLLQFTCCVSFLFIHVFLTNFLTFYDFPLLLYAMFFLSTNITKIDMKKCQNRQNRETRTQIFFTAQPWWAPSCYEILSSNKCQIFLKV